MLCKVFLQGSAVKKAVVVDSFESLVKKGNYYYIILFYAFWIHLLGMHLDTLWPIITNIVNLSLDTCYVPPGLKQAALTPLLKKPSSDHEIFANFRPVSNLKLDSKAIEKTVALRPQKCLHENGLTETLQSAHKNHGCETALVQVQNDILLALDNNECVILLLLIFQPPSTRWITRFCFVDYFRSLEFVVRHWNG